MNNTAAPRARSVSTTRNSRSTSVCVSAAVGSSITITRASAESALAISTICWSAIESPRAMRSGSSLTPSCSNSPAASRRMRRTSMRRPLRSDEDVVCDREVGEERRLLEDDRDAGCVRLRGRVEDDLGAVQEHAPAVGAVHAGQDLDDRGLAGAVLADERERLAAPQLDPAGLQRAHRAE